MYLDTTFYIWNCRVSGLPRFSPLFSIISRSSRSARASSGAWRVFGLPATRDSAHAATSCLTPEPSPAKSFSRVFPSVSTLITLVPATVTVPFSQATLDSTPENVVPQEIAKVPEMPDLVSQIELTVSTGAKCFWRRVV